MQIHKGAGALALGLLMLTNGEAKGLNIHGLNPQLRSVIGQLSDNRPVVLARAVNSVYNVGTSATIMSFTFPAYSLAFGDQIRVQASGIVINNNGAPSNLILGMSTIGGGIANSTLGGYPIAIPIAAGNPNKYCQWRLDAMFSIGVPNAQGNYIPQINVSAATANATYSTGNQPATAFQLVGAVWGLATDASLSGGAFSIGALMTGAGESGAAGIQRPLIYEGSYPIEIDVTITTTNLANMPVTVNAGSMEGL